MSKSKIVLRLLALAAAVGMLSTTAHAQVRISQAWGGGDFSATGPNVDFVELFNAGASSQDLAGWSIQIAGTTGSAWTVIALTGTITPGHYFLVQLEIPDASPTGTTLPTPDFMNPAMPTAGVNAIISSGGKVVLANSTTSVSGLCPIPNAIVIDYVAWGTASCGEGGTTAAAGGLTPGATPTRKLNGCQDTDNNANDFVNASPTSPRNSFSPPGAAGGVLVNVSASPAPANAGASTTITANFTACGGPSPTLTSATVDLLAFGLTATEAMTGGPSSFTFNLNVPISQATGDYTINVSGADASTTYPGSFVLHIIGPPPGNDQCTAPIVVTTSTTNLSIDNSTATSDTDPGACNTGTQGNFGVWYVFTPSAPGTVIFTETSGQDVASGLWVVAAPANPAADCPTFTSAPSLCLGAETWAAKFAVGGSYYLQVGSSGTAAPTVAFSADLTWLSTAPTNDECASAEIIPASSSWPLPFTGVDNRYATDDAIDTCSTTALTIAPHSVWYTYTPSVSGIFTIAETSTQDVAIAVWEPAALPPPSNCTVLTGANVLQCGTAESLSLNAVAGHTYLIMLHSELASPQAPTIAMAGTFTQSLAPPNDLCTNAIDVTVPISGTYSQDVDVRGATPDINMSCDNPLTTTQFGIWHRFAIPAGGDDYVLTLGETSSNDVARAVYTGPDCNNLTQIFCSQTETATTVIVEAGKTYYMLTGAQSLTAVPTINYVVTATSAPATSACCNTSANTCVATSTRTACASSGGVFHGPYAVTCSVTTAAANACQPAPANDLCAGALVLTPGGGASSTTFPAAATDDLDGNCNSTAGVTAVSRFGVWYVFTNGPDAGLLRLNESGTSDVAYQMYSGSCASPVPVACSDTELNVDFFIPGGATRYFLMAMAGNTTTPTAAYNLTAVSFTPFTGACCTGMTCTPLAPSACSGILLGAGVVCSASLSYSTPAPGSCAFEDISASPAATSVVVDSGTTDDGSGPATIPFSFPFYNTAQTSIRIGTNGLILFAPATIADANNRNITPVALPSAAAPNNAIYALWDDLNTTLTAAPEATIKYETRGTSGIDLRFIVQWNRVIHFSQTDLNTFQVILFENGNIDFRYRDITGWTGGTWDFQVAIENSTGTQATVVAPTAIGNGNTCLKFVRFAADPCTLAGACCNGASCSLVANAASCPGAPSNFHAGDSACSPNPCATTDDFCCRGTTCVSVPSGTCTGVIGNSNSLVVGTCGPNNQIAHCCYADFDHSGTSTIDDLFIYINTWLVASPYTKINGNASAAPSIDDLFIFINLWLVGCQP